MAAAVRARWLGRAACDLLADHCVAAAARRGLAGHRHSGAQHVSRARTLTSGSGLGWPCGAIDSRQGRGWHAYSNR